MCLVQVQILSMVTSYIKITTSSKLNVLAKGYDLGTQECCQPSTSHLHNINVGFVTEQWFGCKDKFAM
jgi:hypothetical protein